MSYDGHTTTITTPSASYTVDHSIVVVLPLPTNRDLFLPFSFMVITGHGTALHMGGLPSKTGTYKDIRLPTSSSKTKDLMMKQDDKEKRREGNSR